MNSETDKEVDQWRVDAEKIIQALHERVSALEDAVISQQKMIEALATDALRPKLIRPNVGVRPRVPG